MDWETWVRNPGLPPVTLDFSTFEGNQSSELADEYIRLKGEFSPNNHE